MGVLRVGFTAHGRHWSREFEGQAEEAIEQYKFSIGDAQLYVEIVDAQSGTTRVIDPWRVFHAFGTWYVAGWCHRAEGERLFRVDRVRAVRATGDHFDPATRGLANVAQTIILAAPSYSLRGGTREILRGIIARGLGLR